MHRDPVTLGKDSAISIDNSSARELKPCVDSRLISDETCWLVCEKRHFALYAMIITCSQPSFLKLHPLSRVRYRAAARSNLSPLWRLRTEGALGLRLLDRYSPYLAGSGSWDRRTEDATTYRWQLLALKGPAEVWRLWLSLGVIINMAAGYRALTIHHGAQGADQSR